MKKLIVFIGLIFALSVCAQDNQGRGLKSKVRDLIERYLGSEWSDKLFGKIENNAVEEITLPAIPPSVKKSTDIATYTKKTKGPTEFDKLSQERKRLFNYKFIKELFFVTRIAQAKDEDLSNWLNALDQGGSREGIYQSLVLDEVYSGLESIEERPSKKLIQFCLNFSQKFLKQTFREESLEKLNLYSLKRIFTEKGLDILDYFESRDLDSLYRWYALFSADIAKEDSEGLNSEIRKILSAKYHYEWAKGVPIQHIKSEFIIKIHAVMNKLKQVG